MHYYCEKRTLWPETEEGLKIKQAGSIRILFLDSGLGSYRLHRHTVYPL